MSTSNKEAELQADLKFDIHETILEAAPSEIFVAPGRQRQHFEQKKLDELIEKIAAEGQHTPGLCFQNSSNVHQLIFGERRLRACEALRIPYRYQLTKEPPDPYTLAVLEFSENIAREDLTWREQVDAKAALHKMFQERYGEASRGRKGGHSLRDTAAFLGQSFGNLSDDLEISSYAAVLPEVAGAKNKADAKKIIERLKNGVERELLLDKARSKADETRPVQPEGSFVPSSVSFEDLLTTFDPRVIHGKMEEELSKLPNPSVVLFDPPWGVNFHEVYKPSMLKGTYEDTAERFKELLPGWLTLLYNHMTPASHLYMFFGIVHHGFVYDSLEAAGFTVNRTPIIWHKSGTHYTRNPKQWPGRSYEPIAFARKGSRDLVKRGMPNIIETPAPTPTLKSSHPSAKHPAIYRELIERSALPGDVLLDPMAGSGMAGVAAESLSKTLALDWHLIESDEDFRNLALFNLARGYEELVGATEEPLPDLPSDFRSIQPGSDDWKRYWDTYPEQQDEMLAYRTTLTKG